MASPAQLPPLPQALGFFSRHVASSNGDELLVTERVGIPASYYDVQRENPSGAQPPTVIFRAKGVAFSMGHRKELYDLSGAVLCTIRKDRLHFMTTYVVERADGTRLMEVRNGLRILGSRAVATFVGGRLAGRTLTMAGGWANRNTTIMDDATNAVVARINRRTWNRREILLNKQAYTVTVAPGADNAMVVALCICLDEKRDEAQRRSGGC